MAESWDGAPGRALADLMEGELDPLFPFHCTLCGFCREVCPVGADLPAAMKDLREDSWRRKPALMALRSLGAILFQTLALSHPMTTGPVFPQKKGGRIFFPGCSMSSSDPELAILTWNYLRSKDRDTGIMIGCCGVPYRSIGRSDRADEVAKNLQSVLSERDVSEVIVACPNCLEGLSGLSMPVRSIWSVMDPAELLSCGDRSPAMVHSPCPLRGREGDLQAFLALARSAFPGARERPYRSSGLCCGSGGMSFLFFPDQAKKWRENLRRFRTADERAICGCQSCVETLGGSDSGAVHLLRSILGGDSPKVPGAFGRWINRRGLVKKIGHL